MALLECKLKENVKGPFYIDDTCSACGVCVDFAPSNIELDEDNGFAFIQRQPADEGEKKECYEAMDECPCEAIGDNGEEQ
jgi:ferredoxin